MIGGRIGIAVILKIGDISGIRPGLCRDKAFGLGKLFRNRERGGGGEFTASAAKDAAACVERPVAVRKLVPYDSGASNASSCMTASN